MRWIGPKDGFPQQTGQNHKRFAKLPCSVVLKFLSHALVSCHLLHLLYLLVHDHGSQGLCGIVDFPIQH